MKFVFTGRKIDVTEGIRNVVEEKLSKVEKLLVKDSVAYITISVQKEWQTVEATIHSGDMIIRAEETSRDLYESIDKLEEALVRQIRKYKTKLEKQWRKGGYPLPEVKETYADDEAGEFSIVKRKAFSAKPMDANEAILQMNLLGHQFFVFKDMGSENTQIVYKRKDGNYGLIELD